MTNKKHIAPGGCVRKPGDLAGQLRNSVRGIEREDKQKKQKPTCVICNKNPVEYIGDLCIDCGEKADAEEDGFLIQH